MKKQRKWKNKSGRLGRYKNRNEARKNVLNSWDRALSMGHVKWSVRVQEKPKNGQYVFGFWGWNIDALLLTRIFSVFVSAEALKVAISVPKIHFWWNFDQKHFSGFLWFCFLYFSPNPFFDFSDICEFRWKNNFLVTIFIVFVQFCSQNPPRTLFIIY